MPNRFIRAIAPALLLGGLLLAIPHPVAAECTVLDPWPSFSSAIPTAHRIITGEVTDDRDPNSSGYLAAFGLRIDEVLRGPDRVGDVLDISHLASGLPGTVCPGNSHLRVLPGDVITLGLDARAPDGHSRINVVAWLRGMPESMQRGLGQITKAELDELVALPATDTPSIPEGAPVTQAIAVLSGVMLAFLISFSMVRRLTSFSLRYGMEVVGPVPDGYL